MSSIFKSLALKKGCVLGTAVILVPQLLYIIHTSTDLVRTRTAVETDSAIPHIHWEDGREIFRRRKSVAGLRVGQKCAPRNGMVVSALLGSLGTNLMGVGFANRMAQELCWGVTYTNAWRSKLFLQRGRVCFPSAFLPPPNLTAGAREELHFQSGFDDELLEEEGTLLPCRHEDFCDFSQPEEMLRRIRNETSAHRVLYAKAFFIHHGWIRGWEDEMRNWLEVDTSCCQSESPPEDAVVIHISNLQPDEGEPDVAMKIGFYQHLFEHYGLEDRPVWIVCKPEEKDSYLVEKLSASFRTAHVTTGKDQYDAFCILQRAKTLVLSHKSIFSQAAALSASPKAVVHYPMFNYRPFLTIKSAWKYHLVDPSRTRIKQFAVSADNLTFRMDWETEPDTQVDEIGYGPIELGENSKVGAIENPDGYESGKFCSSWEKNMDEWWTHNPEWVATSRDDSKFCFSRNDDERSHFLRQTYNLQWKGDCQNVHTRHMWSSGWGADFDNIADGLLYSRKKQRPFQITFGPRKKQWWHYAAIKEDGSNPACETKDMFCYFLPLGNCKPGMIEYDTYGDCDEEHRYFKWLTEYSTRPQQWLRRRVYENIKTKAPNVTTPCVAMHVRRADVVLHGEESRRYFPISEYLSKAALKEGTNILIFTDDANAIDEAHEFHPNYNWMYFKRKRHRGTEGGWENQLPSRDPLSEVVILLSMFEVAKKCDKFVHTDSNLADMIYNAMESTGRPIDRVKVDKDMDGMYDESNIGSDQHLANILAARRGNAQPIMNNSVELLGK